MHGYGAGIHTWSRHFIRQRRPIDAGAVELVTFRACAIVLVCQVEGQEGADERENATQRSGHAAWYHAREVLVVRCTCAGIICHQGALKGVLLLPVLVQGTRTLHWRKGPSMRRKVCLISLFKPQDTSTRWVSLVNLYDEGRSSKVGFCRDSPE
jgi:hypothetical protein